MGSRISGITIVLHNKVKSGEDAFGRPQYTETAEEIDNVLVGQPSAQEILDTYNLTGKKIVYTLGIPKGDTHTWTDRKITFFGEDWRAVAAPVQGIEDNIPLSWNKQVKVERYA